MAAVTWTIAAGGLAPCAEPLPSEILESFARLDAVARSAKFDFASAPVADCPRPFLDVHLHDDAGNLLIDVPVTLDFPAGAGQRKNSDSKGCAHFPDVSVDAAGLEVELLRDWPAGEDRPRYRARVHQKVPAAPGTRPIDPAAEEPYRYDLPFYEESAEGDEEGSRELALAFVPDPG